MVREISGAESYCKRVWLLLAGRLIPRSKNNHFKHWANFKSFFIAFLVRRMTYGWACAGRNLPISLAENVKAFHMLSKQVALCICWCSNRLTTGISFLKLPMLSFLTICISYSAPSTSFQSVSDLRHDLRIERYVESEMGEARVTNVDFEGERKTY